MAVKIQKSVWLAQQIKSAVEQAQYESLAHQDNEVLSCRFETLAKIGKGL